MTGEKGWRELRRMRQKEDPRHLFIEVIAAVIIFASFITLAIITFPMDPY